MDQDYRERISRDSWKWWFKTDPETARLKLILAKCSRIQSSSWRGNNLWVEAEREAWDAQRALLTLWERRREAKRVNPS